MMMRTSQWVFVCSMFVAACASSGDGGTGNPSPDASTASTPVCGDAVCAASEVGSCTADCGDGGGNGGGGGGGGGVTAVCGNGTCENGETTASCPNDCGGGGGGGGGGGSTTCPADPTECFICILSNVCPAGLDANSCTTCIAGGGGGGGLPGCNLDGVCDAGEDPMTCPDCP